MTAPEDRPLAFPYLLLLISGGHCQLLDVEGVGRYRRLGTTIDDAAGEAFDKAAAMLELGFPGGPALEESGPRRRSERPCTAAPDARAAGRGFLVFGLKTALRQAVAAAGRPLDPARKADFAASFQAAIADVLVDRTGHAIDAFASRHGAGHTLVVAGGVAANTAIRTALTDLARRRAMAIAIPPVALWHRQCCHGRLGRHRETWRSAPPMGSTSRPAPGWPLDAAAAMAGAKA